MSNRIILEQLYKTFTLQFTINKYVQDVRRITPNAPGAIAR